MVYEVEKRVLFDSKEMFDRCEEAVQKRGQRAEGNIYKSFLFSKPSYLRIRIVRGKDSAEVTIKKGTYEDVAREEKTEFVKLVALKDYVAKLLKQGYESCACVKTENQDYIVDGLKVSFNVIEELGRIVEIEGLTEDEGEVGNINEQIVFLMGELGLEELGVGDYQKMMDKMYKKTTKPIFEQELVV